MNEHTRQQKEEANKPFEPANMSEKKNLIAESLEDVWSELAKRHREILRLRGIVETYDQRLASHCFRIGDKVVVNDKGSAMGINGERGTVKAVAGLMVMIEHDDGGYNTTMDGLFLNRIEG